MKQKILLGICAVLIFLLGFQISNLVSLRSNKKNNKVETIQKIDEEALTSSECNGQPVVANSTLLRDYRGENIAASCLSGNNTLVCRFSANACRPCVDAVTTSLINFATTHPEWHIFILLSKMRLRDLYVLAPQLGSQFTLLDCNNLPVDFNDGETPVLFQVDNDGRVYNHFTCRYGDYDRTDRYLDGL